MARLPTAQQLLSESGTNDSKLLSTTINESANGLNGIINYAQLLLESEGADQFGVEHRKMLENIIDNGERIAGQWQKISQHFTS